MMTEPNNYDVLCGRGGATNGFVGNKRYRQIVKDHQDEYLNARKKDKVLIARRIVSIIRQNGGRFLRRDEASQEWVDVGDKKATEKTSQSLREGLDVRQKTAHMRGHRRSGSDTSQLSAAKKRARKVTPTRTVSSDEMSPVLMGLQGEPALLPELDFPIFPEFNNLQNLSFQPMVSAPDCDNVVAL
mmetsp:Transcript_1214/g.1717  ORF Transcript_1214/g.1717 Transcript_1214/m.1717 type:complete len:186 (-) Transcript_1214:171-728(-)